MLKMRFLLALLALLPAVLAAQPSAISGMMAAQVASVVARVPQSVLLDYLRGRSDLVVVDARSLEEYETGHIDRALNIPPDAGDQDYAALPADLGTQILVYCKTGNRAEKLQANLLARGYTDVSVLGKAEMTWAGDLPVFNCGMPDSPQANN